MHFLNKNMFQNYIFRIIPTQEISFLHRTAAFWNKKMCLSDKPKRPSDSQARRDSYADCVLCRRIFKNLDRKIFEKCHDIKVDLNFQGGLLYTAAYVRWDFFIGIISLRFAEDLLRTEGSIGAKRHSIPLCHPISLSLSPQYLGD